MTSIRQYEKCLTTNASDASFPSRVATATEPSGGGVVALGLGEDTIELLPYGTGNDDTTFDIRVIGWRKIVDSSTSLWVPYVICQAQCVNSTAVGVSGKPVVNTERFSDSNTITYGVGVSPTVPANTIAPLYVDVSGFAKFEVTFDMTGATNANALYAAY